MASAAVVGPPAWAQSPQELVDIAQGAYDDGRYAEAAASFERAYAAHAHPAIRWNVARAWEKAGELERARDQFVALVEDCRAPACGAGGSAGHSTLKLLPRKAALALARVDRKLARRAAATGPKALERVLVAERAEASLEGNHELVRRLDGELDAVRAVLRERRTAADAPPPASRTPAPGIEGGAGDPGGSEGFVLPGWVLVGTGGAMLVAGALLAGLAETRYDQIQSGITADGLAQKLSNSEEAALRSEGRGMRIAGWSAVGIGAAAGVAGALLVALGQGGDEASADTVTLRGGVLPGGGLVSVRAGF